MQSYNVKSIRTFIGARNLPGTYKGVRFTEIKEMDWGREFFMHDPSGVLWHYGEFKS